MRDWVQPFCQGICHQEIVGFPVQGSLYCFRARFLFPPQLKITVEKLKPATTRFEGGWEFFVDRGGGGAVRSSEKTSRLSPIRRTANVIRSS